MKPFGTASQAKKWYNSATQDQPRINLQYYVKEVIQAMRINSKAIVRTAVLIVALINNIITMMDMNPLPFSDEETYAGISALATAAASLWTWWKNNTLEKAEKNSTSFGEENSNESMK